VAVTYEVQLGDELHEADDVVGVVAVAPATTDVAVIAAVTATALSIPPTKQVTNPLAVSRTNRLG
jgi:hypothetical protein